MAAILSPLQLQAAAGLFQNKGYQVNPGVTAAVNEYTATPLLTNLILAMNESGRLANANVELYLQTFAGNVSNSCPALADSFNKSLTYPVTSTRADPGLTGIITLTANAYMGNGDLSKFVQTFTQANSYCSITNTFINSAVNSNNYLGPTFTGMDNLVTAGLTEINRATQAMGDDLYNAGQYIDLGNLANYGTPLALIRQISRRAGTISLLISPLIDAGVDENIVLGINDPSVAVTDSVQKLMYNALTTVTGDELASILRILDVWTPNINTLADLLNPAIMLPNSYSSLTVPTADGPRAIYITPEANLRIDYADLSPEENQTLLEQEAANRTVERPLACELRQSENPVTASAAPEVQQGGTGSGASYTPNSNLEATVAGCQTGTSYERLSIMTDPGLALVNKALTHSLSQVTNIGRMNLPQLAAAFLAVETNKDLPAIEAQTTPVPPADLNYYDSNIAIGSGENGTILLTDILGTAAGTNITENLNNCVTIINTMYNAGQLDNLITIYDDIYANVMASDAGNANTLITAAQAEIVNIKANINPTACAELNTYFSAINTQLTREATLLTRAAIDIGNVQGNNQIAIMSFATSLPGYGLDTKVGGSAQYLEEVTEKTTVDGVPVMTPSAQSTVATLREGRTTTGLNAAGVGTASNAVDSTPATPSPQATLLPSRYSEAQAQAQVIY
jgi:hypothetical protein